MTLSDPVAAYNAASNVEAHLVRNALEAAGIAAFVIEDVSQIGTWMGGLVPELHKPQVWIERDDLDRAKPVLDDYEAKAGERITGGPGESGEGPPIEVVCDGCQARLMFPAAQRGSVQECPKCGAYLDVGEEEPLEGWDEVGEGEEGDEGQPFRVDGDSE